MYIERTVVAQATFGRDGAMFESLLGFVAQLSLVLWGLVVFTAIIRFVGIRIYRRGISRPGPIENVVSSTAFPPAAADKAAGLVDVVAIDAAMNATIDEVLQSIERPAVDAASGIVPLRTPRDGHAVRRSPAHMPALTSNSTEK
jgi:hypothetical protein